MKQPLATEEITGSTDAPVEETPVAVGNRGFRRDKADSRSPSLERPAKIKFGPEPTEPYVEEEIEIPVEPKRVV